MREDEVELLWQETLFELPALRERNVGKPGRPRVTGIGNMTQRSKMARAEYWRAQSRERSARNYARRSDWFRRMKEHAGCAVCGERFHASLDFHHRDPGEKVFQVNSNRASNKAALFVEARKCVLLCKNCHYKVEHGALDISEIESFEPLAVLAEMEAKQ